MKSKSGRAMLQVTAAGLLLFSTGCETVETYSLTYRVWDNGEWRKFSEPAPNPNLALFEATSDGGVLVQYGDPHRVDSVRRGPQTRVSAP